MDYIKNRLDNQISWYSKKSRANQTNYKRLQLSQIALALSIPILTTFIDQFMWVKYIIAVIGGLIAFLEGVEKIYNFKELWTKYRITSEALKREKIFYETNLAPYDKADPISELIKRCEHIMNDENKNWKELQVKKEKNA